MSGLNIQNSRINQKYSTISGSTPSIAPSTDHTDGTWNENDIYIGELYINVQDDAMFFRSLNGIIPITSGTTTIDTTAFLNLTGGTLTGTLYAPTISATTISASTIYSPSFNGTFVGDGSGLTGITSTSVFSGGTVSGATIFTSDVDLCSANVTINEINNCGGHIDIYSDINVVGAVSATTFEGDGSLITNLPYVSGLTLDQVLTLGDTSASNNIELTNGNITLTNGTYFGDGSGLTGIPPSPIPTLDEVLVSGDTSTNGNIYLTNGDIVLGNGIYYGDGSGLTNLIATNDVFVTGGTYSSGTAIFTNNSGGTFNVTGFTSGVSGDFLPLSGGTVSGGTQFTAGLTANTISATTYQNLPINTDVFVTGGTYNNGTGIATFTNNTGSTFNVTGFTTGFTETQNLTNVLALGNTTGANDIIVEDGQKIESVSGNTSIEFVSDTELNIVSTGDVYISGGTSVEIEYYGSPNITSYLLLNNTETTLHMDDNGVDISTLTLTPTSLTINVIDSGTTQYEHTIVPFESNSTITELSTGNYTSVFQDTNNINNTLQESNHTNEIISFSNDTTREITGLVSNNTSTNTQNINQNYVENINFTLDRQNTLGILSDNIQSQVVEMSTSDYSLVTQYKDTIETTVTDGTDTSSQIFTPLLIELEVTSPTNSSTIELEANSLNIVSTDTINIAGISVGLGTSVTSTVTDGTGTTFTNMTVNDYNISSSDGTDTSTQTHTANSIISTAADVALNITDTITLDPQGSINNTGIRSEDATTLDYTLTTHTPTQISLNNYSTSNDRDINFVITADDIILTNTETSTGYFSFTGMRSFMIESEVVFNDGEEKTSKVEIGNPEIKLRQTNNDTGEENTLIINSENTTLQANNNALTKNDTISLDPGGVSLGTGIKSEDTTTGNIASSTYTPDTIISTANDVATNITDTITLDPQGLGNGTGIFSTDGTNTSTQTFTPNEITSTVTDNGYGYFSSKEIKPQQHQSQFSREANIFVIEDKRSEWTQTADATTTLLIYCDVDPLVIISGSSIVQIKAHVRGISSDKTTGYAAEIISWVRLDQLAITPITQIGVVDSTIKSEFTTASSSFVISGPNMYIDVTGEVGITIDWTCNVEILYDKNTF